MKDAPAGVDGEWLPTVRLFLHRKRHEEGRSPGTLEQYTTYLARGRLLDWMRGQGITHVSQMTRETILDFLEWVSSGTVQRRPTPDADHTVARPIAKMTVRFYGLLIRAFLRWCAEEEYPVDPRALTMKVRKMPRALPQPMTQHEMDAVAAKARSPRDAFLLDFMNHTALRLHEVVAVTLDSVHQDDRTGAMYLAVRGKGAKDRIVPLDTDDYKLSREYRKYVTSVRPPQAQARTKHLFLGERAGPDGLYPPLSRDGLRSVIRRLQQSTGVRVHAHRYRHTYATRHAGENPLDLQKILGHERLDMVNTYAATNTSQLLERWSTPRSS